MWHVIATSSAVALQSVPAHLAGMAGTANNVVRQLGAALGAAVIGGVVNSRLAGGDITGTGFSIVSRCLDPLPSPGVFFAR